MPIAAVVAKENRRRASLVTVVRPRPEAARPTKPLAETARFGLIPAVVAVEGLGASSRATAAVVVVAAAVAVSITLR